MYLKDVENGYIYTARLAFPNFRFENHGVHDEIYHVNYGDLNSHVDPP